MKILQLDLIPFGPFADQSLDFREGHHGLHLVYGANEAGKSSTLRALTQVLFGIEPRTPDNFRFAYSNLKLGATLADHRGNELRFLRLKRTKDPLRSTNNEVLNENCLEAFLGHVDRNTFVRQFGLNRQTLEEGGQEMVRSEGELARILFAAGSGLSALTEVQDGIEKEMRELFLPTGSNPKINELLDKYRDIEAQLREVRLTSQEWKRHADALEEARHLQRELAERKKSLECERRRLQRIENAKRPIQKYRETHKELADLKDVVLLPPDFCKRRQKARDQLLKARQTQSTLKADLLRLAEQLQTISVNRAVLEHAAEIESLYQEIGQYLGSVQDCPQIDSQRESAEKEARHLLKNIRPDFPFEKADDLRIAEEDRALIRELGPDYKALADRVESARREFSAAERQLAELLDLQKAQSEVPDLSTLKSALKRATERGRLEEELEEKQRAVADAELSANNECHRLPFWPGTLEDLEKIKIPYRETVMQFQSRLDQSAKEIEEREQELERVRGALREHAEQFERLERDGEVPTEEDLANARRLREQGWKLILNNWQDGMESKKGLEEFLNQTDAPDLAAGFEKSVARADAVSDLLRREALRVNEKKRLIEARQMLDTQLPELQSRIAEHRLRQETIEQEWRALWTPLGIEPGTPAEMREWLQSHLQLMAAVKNLHPQQLYLERLGDLIGEHRRQMISALEPIRPTLKHLSKRTLRDLIELSQSVLEEIGELQRRKERLEEDIHKIQQSLPKLEQETHAAEAKLSAWQKEWVKRMAKLGLAENATPGQANSILDLLDRLFEQLRKEEEFAIRVRAMRDFNRQFEDRVRAVALVLDWNAEEAPPAQIVNQLHSELARGREAAHKQHDLQMEQQRQDKDLQLSEQQIAASEAELRELCKIAGCEDPEDLPSAERDAARKEQLEQIERETREQILQFTGDTSFEIFLGEADAEEADGLTSQLTDLDREIEEVETQLEKQIQQTTKEESLLESKSGGSQAAIAAEEKQQVLAEMAQHLERYVQLRLAHEALREGAERYRKKHQGPVLKRASELFSKLTCGSFLRLQNDGDAQGKPHLVGIRSHEGQEETVEVKGMSDGTADQLYLALRIASLEDWLDHHPRVPFIVDDILINFDDQRAIAALKVLAELSQRTQVIFFTHHQHLVELAEQHLPADVCFHHYLGETGKPRRRPKRQPAKDTGATTLF